MAAKQRKPLREYEELIDAEKRIIIQAFHSDYLGTGFIDRYRITKQCYRTLKEESRK